MRTDPIRPTDVADATWHRMHPITPLLKGWAAILIGLGVVANWLNLNPWSLAQAPFNTEELQQGQRVIAFARSAWMPVLGGALLYAGLVAALCYLTWTRTRYCVTGEAVHLASGIVTRNRRQARLDRLQAVDIAQPLFARIFGLAKLTLVMAGSSESKLELAYLKESVANQLRAELLARAAGLRLAQAGKGDEAAAPSGLAPAGGQPVQPQPLGQVAPGPAASPVLAPVAPETSLLEVPTARLARALVRLALLPTIVVVVLLVGAIWALLASGQRAALGAVAGPLVPVVVVLVGFAWSFLSQNFAFRIAISPDGLRLYHGLVEKKSQTVPPGRIQAVGLSQPLLWRGPGWWRIRMNVAGLASAEGESSDTVLLPVGTLQEVERVLDLILPGQAAPGDEVTRRSVLLGLGPAPGLTCAPARARLLDPLSWRRNGYAVTGPGLWLRGGRLTRRATFVPHERTQSLRVTQGPMQHMLGVATFRADTVPGPVAPLVEHLTTSDAAELLDGQAARARRARAAAGPEQWMVRLRSAGTTLAK